MQIQEVFERTVNHIQWFYGISVFDRSDQNNTSGKDCGLCITSRERQILNMGSSHAVYWSELWIVCLRYCSGNRDGKYKSQAHAAHITGKRSSLPKEDREIGIKSYKLDIISVHVFVCQTHHLLKHSRGRVTLVLQHFQQMDRNNGILSNTAPLDATGDHGS